MPLQITDRIQVPDEEIELSAIRAQGAGGQNVNKVSTAIHLRFDVNASSLPDRVKQGLLALQDRRISKQGVIVIKAQTARSQEANRDAALERLRELILGVTRVRRTRVPTRPTRASQQRRVAGKTRRGRLKRLRGAIHGDD